MTQYDYDKFVNRLFSKVVSSSQHFNYEASNHPCAVEKRGSAVEERPRVGGFHVAGTFAKSLMAGSVQGNMTS